jgi:hypothetical protein
MASTLARFESSGFLQVGTPNNPGVHVCSSCWQQRGNSLSHCGCLTDYPQLRGRPWWDVSRRASNLMAGVLSSYYKCTLSAVAQIKCLRTHVDMDILSCFGMWSSCPKSVSTFQLHSVYSVDLPMKITKALNFAFVELQCVCSLCPTWCLRVSEWPGRRVLRAGNMPKPTGQ